MLTAFQKSLDRYLTTEPDDYFTPYCEKVIEAFSDSFYESVYETDLMCGKGFPDSRLENEWLNELFSKGYDPILSAKIIERAYRIFIEIKKESYD